MGIPGILTAGLVVLGIVLASTAQGRAGGAMTTLHSFDNTGYAPWAGIAADRNGDLLGTTTAGGTGSCTAGLGCGTVFRIVPPAGSGRWTYETLYNFQGGEDGYFPVAPVTPDRSGAVYGYTAAGTHGTVFGLLPPSRTGANWTFEILYIFQGGSDGDLFSVYAPLIFAKGRIYGIAGGGAATGCGSDGCGSVFRLDPGGSGERWTKETLFTFAGGPTSGRPQWIAGPDTTGSLYVSTAQGEGAVARLSPPAGPGAAWTETLITTFAGGLDGRAPGELLLAADGTLLGLAAGTRKAGGLVYRLTPPGSLDGEWTRSVVAYVKDHNYAPVSLAFGAGDTLIGAVEGDFDFFAGSIYQLTPPATGDSSWTFAELWDFNHGPDRNPLNAILGRGGNIFSILNGGDSTSGSVVELRRD
jgi:hypothetical protein